YTMPKKVRRLALKSAYSSKVQNDEVLVLDSLSFETPKTKDFVQMLNALSADKKTLVVTADENENVVRSANNLKSVKVLPVSQVSVLDLISHDKLILTKDAAQIAGEVLA